MTDKIKDKIAALLAKAEGTDNLFEADSFMAKVNELLERHQMDLHEIRKHSGVNTDPIGKTAGETNIYASMLWARGVAGALAKYYGCEFIYWKRGNHFTYRIVGPESARMTFELLLPFVISQVRQQANRLWIARGGKSKSVWEREVGQALQLRVYRLVPQVEAKRAENTANGLVPVSDLKAFLDAEFGEIKTARATNYDFGFAAKQAAETISINVQATGKTTKLIGKDSK